MNYYLKLPISFLQTIDWNKIEGGGVQSCVFDSLKENFIVEIKDSNYLPQEKRLTTKQVHSELSKQSWQPVWGLVFRKEVAETLPLNSELFLQKKLEDCETNTSNSLYLISTPCELIGNKKETLLTWYEERQGKYFLCYRKNNEYLEFEFEKLVFSEDWFSPTVFENTENFEMFMKTLSTELVEETNKSKVSWWCRLWEKVKTFFKKLF